MAWACQHNWWVYLLPPFLSKYPEQNNSRTFPKNILDSIVPKCKGRTFGSHSTKTQSFNKPALQMALLNDQMVTLFRWSLVKVWWDSWLSSLIEGERERQGERAKSLSVHSTSHKQACTSCSGETKLILIDHRKDNGSDTTGPHLWAGPAIQTARAVWAAPVGPAVPCGLRPFSQRQLRDHAAPESIQLPTMTGHFLFTQGPIQLEGFVQRDPWPWVNQRTCQRTNRGPFSFFLNEEHPHTRTLLRLYSWGMLFAMHWILTADSITSQFNAKRLLFLRQKQMAVIADSQ